MLTATGAGADADLTGVVQGAQRALAEKLTCREGSQVTFGGQFEEATTST